MQADAAARGNLPEIIRNAGAAGCKDIHLDDFNLSNGGKDLISDATLMLAFGRRYGLIGRNGTGERVESSSSWGRHWGRLFIEARMMSWRWGLGSDLCRIISHQSSFLSPVLPSPHVMPGGFAWAWILFCSTSSAVIPEGSAAATPQARPRYYGLWLSTTSRASLATAR